MSHPVKTPNYLWKVLAVVLGAYLLVVALPRHWVPWIPHWMNPDLHLGLDLQGGTQLDFRISETEMQKQIEQLNTDIAALEATQGSPDDIAEKRAQIANIRSLGTNVVEAIRTVLERRVNSLGVSEAVITPSYYGTEKHLLVECPGMVDVQQCIKTVGKTILLEFKEQSTGEDEEHIATMRNLAAQAEQRLSGTGATFAAVGEDMASTLGVTYRPEDRFFQDELPPGLEDIWSRKTTDAPILREVTVGMVTLGDTPTLHRGLILASVTGDPAETDRTFTNPILAMQYLAESEKNLTLTEKKDLPLEKLDSGYAPMLDLLVAQTLTGAVKENGTRTIVYVEGKNNGSESMEASHILITYDGAARAGSEITRTKEEAAALAEELHNRIVAGEKIATLAEEYSDDPGSKTNGGSLGTFDRLQMTAGFSDAAFALKKGGLSSVVETEFGFHIIQADSDPVTAPSTISLQELAITGEDAEAAQTQWLDALKNNTVSKKDQQMTLQTIFFSFLPTGWKDTPLDGKHFQRATVTTDPISGIPVVQIVFDSEGGRIFQDLTARNVGKPIAIFVGGELISAPTVQGEIAGGIAIITGSQNFEEANTLAQDLNTGAIPAPIYLVGQSTVEATLGEQALYQSINAALIGFVLIAIYMIFFYRVLGLIAVISLSAYSIIFTALLKLPLALISGQYIVLTLAGIAGIILSIGMAVDANVLIFERMKEELKKGKLLSTAADTGFKRAWTSIWASNISTLITASILFTIGTSIVRGFAVTLTLGILLSMFTAVVMTRFLISLLYKSPLAENPAAFGVRK